jgi:predicted PurR-regulated permease PerM
MIDTGPIVVFVFVLFIAIIIFIGFVIYFFFKILQFVVQATNLYKKILRREDTIIKILLDIRDNTKKVQIDWNQIDSESR